jgi:hypothetical protein
VKRRRTRIEGSSPLRNRSRRKAWNLFSLVPPQIQESRKMMRVSHGKQQQERRHWTTISLLFRESSSAEPRETRKEARARKRKEALEKELEDESDLTLSDDSSDKEDSAQRKLSLSPTQFLESKATGPLRGSRASQQRAMERPSAPNAPI